MDARESSASNVGDGEPVVQARQAQEGQRVDEAGGVEMEWEGDEPQRAEAPGRGLEGEANLGPAIGESTPVRRIRRGGPRRQVEIEDYPDPSASAPVRPERYDVETRDFAEHELADPRLFETAHWLGNLPISVDQRAEFFKHENNQHLPLRSHRDFDKTVDSIPHGPSWHRQYVKIEGDDGVEEYEMHSRNLLEGVEFILSNQKFTKSLKYSAEAHWLRGGKGKKRLYSEMWTGLWWWRVQLLLEKGATVAPLILSSDKTQLSVFSRGKLAWPVYLSIGNISKRVQRRPSQGAMMLVAYLPVANITCVTSAKDHREKSWRLFHACMQILLEPIKEVSCNSQEALCADGYIRQIHPILAAYIADFPEQCLVTCARQNRCPVCVAPSDNRGDTTEYRKRTMWENLDAIEDKQHGYTGTADRLGIRPIWPFWADLQYVDIASCVTPDLLHQLNKGVFRDHVVKWCTKLLGQKEVDRRLKGMPRFQGLRHFRNGTSVISQWTGMEAKQLGKTFIPLLAGCREAEAVAAARSVVDFMYRAHMPELSDDDLDALDNDLAEFHDSKESFQETGVLNTTDMFNGIPKIHMLSHYTQSIRELGTTDGYNTEAPERLHIDYVKDGWQMSNKLNATEQMALYLQRMEAWALFRAYHHDLGQLPPSIRDRDAPMEGEGQGTVSDILGYIDGEDDAEDEAGDVEEVGRVQERDSISHPNPRMTAAKRPTLRTKPASYLIDKHGTTNLIRDVQAFLNTISPHNTRIRLKDSHRFRVWTRVKLFHRRLPFLPSAEPHVEHLRARPATRKDRADSFDTALFMSNPSAHGLHRYKAGRIRAIFELPSHLSYIYPGKLAYVEHFRPFSSACPDPH